MFSLSFPSLLLLLLLLTQLLGMVCAFMSVAVTQWLLHSWRWGRSQHEYFLILHICDSEGENKIWWDQQETTFNDKVLGPKWEVRAWEMRWVIWGVRVPGGKQGCSWARNSALVSHKLPLHMCNSEMQAAESLVVHRWLKARMGQKCQCGGYFRSWTTMI